MGTLIHHMLRQQDFDGMHQIFNVLRPNQKIQFDARNNSGNTILHEMIKQNNYNELKYLLDVINQKSNENEFNFGGFNDLGESILFLALEQDRMSLMDLPSNNQQKEEEYDDDENKDEQ